MKYAYFKGKIVPIEEAKISIMTHAFNYGTGVFEGIRGYYNEKENTTYLLHLKEHYERLRKSAKILKINIRESNEELAKITIELSKKHNYKEDFYIRPIAYKSSEKVGVRLHDLESDLAIFTVPFGPYLDTTKGIRTMVSSWTRIDDNMIPARGKVCGAYVNSAFSKTEAMENGYDEALVLTKDGHISEGSAENIFIVRDGALITPPVTENILEGIVRKSIIEILENELNLKVIERRIDRTELYIADEIFLCGTGAQISPVTEVDKRVIGDSSMGRITKSLQNIYFNIVRGQNEKYMKWLTKI